MKNQSVKSSQPKPVSRRALLKAGWVVPAIAVTPLMNTATAASTVNCDTLLEKRELHRANGDKDAYDDIMRKLHENGCFR